MQALMEKTDELEIVELGDATLETKCSAAGGPQIDNFYGPFHWAHC